MWHCFSKYLRMLKQVPILTTRPPLATIHVVRWLPSGDHIHGGKVTAGWEPHTELQGIGSFTLALHTSAKAIKGLAQFLLVPFVFRRVEVFNENHDIGVEVVVQSRVASKWPSNVAVIYQIESRSSHSSQSSQQLLKTITLRWQQTESTFNCFRTILAPGQLPSVIFLFTVSSRSSTLLIPNNDEDLMDSFIAANSQNVSKCIHTDLLAIDELHTLNWKPPKANTPFEASNLLLPYRSSQASASRKISSKDGRAGASFSAPSLPCHSDMSWAWRRGVCEGRTAELCTQPNWAKCLQIGHVFSGRQRLESWTIDKFPRPLESWNIPLQRQPRMHRILFPYIHSS